jgi:hypothetical protein
MYQHIKSSAWKCLRYFHSVVSAVVHPQMPLVHIALHPFVPYVKYVAPVGLAITVARLTSIDAMMIRIISDEDARCRNLARRDSDGVGSAGCSSNQEHKQLGLAGK